MIKGTPIHAEIDDMTVTIFFAHGDENSSVSFDLDSEEEAKGCYMMWESLISVAMDAPVNEHWDDIYDA
jgi:hypothetical protein